MQYVKQSMTNSLNLTILLISAQACSVLPICTCTFCYKQLDLRYLVDKCVDGAVWHQNTSEESYRLEMTDEAERGTCRDGKRKKRWPGCAKKTSGGFMNAHPQPPLCILGL